MEVVLLLAALAFAVANGLNDGSALVAVGLRVRGLLPLTAIGLLTLGVVVTPLVLGTPVATTLAGRLISFHGPAGPSALLAAVASAVAVPTLLARRGLPTSLTLALVGAIAGAGVGSGLTVAWGTLGLVLGLAAVAPFAGAVVARLSTRVLAAIRSGAPLERRVRRGHVVGFASQCVAYGLNDGQKMLAVVAVAAAAAAGTGPARPVTASVGVMAAIGICFLLGTAIGLPKVAVTLTRRVVPVQPPAAVISELSSAAVVLAAGAIGSPVSMTQAISGALVGSASSGTRVRWRDALRLLGAWVVTLPASAVLAAALAAVAIRTIA